MKNFTRKKKKRKNNELKIKKIVSFLFLIVLISSVSFYLISKDTNNDSIEKETEIEEMKLSDSLLPIRKWEIDAPTIDARSGVVTYVNLEGDKKFVFEKNKDLKVPIASITKLMTALIVLENYDLNETITISDEIFSMDFSSNNFFPREEYRVKDLVYSLLMESNNAVSYILAQEINFVELMNKKALDLGMTNTYFVNPSGLDPLNTSDTANYSTARDLINLIEAVLEKPLIVEILSTSEYDLIRQDGFFKYTVINTNELLFEMPEIIMGKTGTTKRAGQCLVLAVSKNNKGYLISVILGSRDRFNETRKIIDWAKKAYYWEINKW